MPCISPFPAWKTPTGELSLTARSEDFVGLKLPCGQCIECRRAKAREWAVRCSLELQCHSKVCWTTLTYEEKYKPPTLKKSHLSGWLKRLRETVARMDDQTRIRFFASGEYGEQTKRPHYHAILYGLDKETKAIAEAWPFGQTQTLAITPGAIAYVAGYTSKKYSEKHHAREGERVDHNGEPYQYQPPFIQMSRGGRNGHGIGGNARQYWQSWKKTAINGGYEIPVPRYLHEAWKANATQEEIQQLEQETAGKIYDKIKAKLAKGIDEIKLMRNREINAVAKQRLATEKRNTL